ncbi:hypothetical protein KUTeg_013702 [Tegillarca granosa]|uniref:Glycosyl transferase 64 domain-containing protein n=1 Tax=Tegillarca granosa TaxID=220873 RepID=A0ABQ9EUG5_TEGGR|nr:hypothetical protein KUTeg_013702 [Tegillarca granosa]
MMTHKREKQLIAALMHLNGLSSLNKTIIVWNDPKQSPPDFTNLNLTYEIQILKQKQNSINNRFLIYEEINTDAILTLDDDVYISHNVILLCFRVWKSDKYALVGVFPRRHDWNHRDQKWHYNAGNFCPTSMVLLGCAFYNKIYNYMYRTLMPKAIIRFVDEIFNCEDLAMNFLVANFTRRPPIRVKYQTSAYCKTCTSNLSLRKNHYEDRSKCLNQFSNIYGYMPLLYTYTSVNTDECLV